MKAARFVLKVVAISMADMAGAAAVACAVAAYWDRIVDVFYAIADKIEEKKADIRFASEYEDYDDCAL